MGHRPLKGTGRVYAIAYDLNKEAAERHGAWAKIARVLKAGSGVSTMGEGEDQTGSI
jgi:hypothetical protein